MYHLLVVRNKPMKYLMHLRKAEKLAYHTLEKKIAVLDYIMQVQKRIIS